MYTVGQVDKSNSSPHYNLPITEIATYQKTKIKASAAKELNQNIITVKQG